MRVVTPTILLGLMFVMRALSSSGAYSKDASDMIRIPAGMFLMGSINGPEDERPQQQVNVGEFFGSVRL
jgi:formylglycine-generating enzyme required for sulfatase activity